MTRKKKETAKSCELDGAVSRLRRFHAAKNKDSEESPYWMTTCGDFDGDKFNDDNETVAAAWLTECDDGQIDKEWMKSIGFKWQRLEGGAIEAYAIGSPHATLFVVEGYSEGKLKRNYWACVGKYTEVQNAAATCAHFNKRLYNRGDVLLLCRALGIELKAVPA